MPVAFVGANSVLNSTSGTSTAVPMPAGFTAGHTLFVMVASVGASPVPTAPSGWSLVASFTPGSTLASYLYRKTANGSEPTSTWSWSSAGRNLGLSLAYSGIDGTLTVTAAQSWVHDAPTNAMVAPSVGAGAADWLATIGLARENPGTATAKDWTISTGTNVQRIDVSTAGAADDIKVTGAWFDSNGAVGAGSTSRTVSVTPEMQQAHIWSILLRPPASETATGNPWTHMGRPQR